MVDLFRPLNRAELARVFGNSPEIIRAFEKLQELAGGKTQTDIFALQQGMSSLETEVKTLAETVADMGDTGVVEVDVSATLKYARKTTEIKRIDFSTFPATVLSHQSDDTAADWENRETLVYT